MIFFGLYKFLYFKNYNNNKYFLNLIHVMNLQKYLKLILLNLSLKIFIVMIYILL